MKRGKIITQWFAGNGGLVCFVKRGMFFLILVVNNSLLLCAQKLNFYFLVFQRVGKNENILRAVKHAED